MRILAPTVGLLLILLVAFGRGPARAEEGVVEINQAKALAGGVTETDLPGFPVTIDAFGFGSYRLTSNLEVSDVDTDAIEIAGSSVEIDLNGFAIQGPVSCTTTTPPVCGATGIGRGVNGSGAIAVRNGLIRGVGGIGVSVGTGGVVENLIVAEVGGDAILLSGRSVARNNVIAFCNGDGIQDSAPNESLVEGNLVRQCGGLGLNLGLSTVYSENVLRDNNGGFGAAQVSGGLAFGRNLCDTAFCP